MKVKHTCLGVLATLAALTLPLTLKAQVEPEFNLQQSNPEILAVSSSEQVRQQITDNFYQADIKYGLRQVLEEVGFNPQEELYITFIVSHEGQEYTYQTNAIPAIDHSMATLPATSLKSSAIDDKKDCNVNKTLTELLNKIEEEQSYQEPISSELNLPKENEFDATIKFSDKSQEYIIAGRLYCPCFPGAAFCCFR